MEVVSLFSSIHSFSRPIWLWRIGTDIQSSLGKNSCKEDLNLMLNGDNDDNCVILHSSMFSVS